MTPSEKYESVHGVDSYYELKPKDKSLKYLKYFIIFLTGNFLGYMIHLMLLRVSI